MPGRRGPMDTSQRAGRIARTRRRFMDLSQSDLAERMRASGHETWSRVCVSEVEAGRRALSLDEYVALWRCLGMSEGFVATPDLTSEAWAAGVLS